MHQERATSPPSSGDATGQALSKKARALARIRPFAHSFAASVDNGTGAPSAAKMSTAWAHCLRRFVEGGRNGLWPRNRERFFLGPQH